MSKQKKQVFICHSSRDKRFVERLANSLKTLNIDVWFDKWALTVGDSIHSKIAEAIESADHLIVVISEESIRSPWVTRELNAALSREIDNKTKFVLPVFLSGPNELLPTFLRDKLYADFRVSEDEGFRELCRSIDAHTCDTQVFQKLQVSLPEIISEVRDNYTSQLAEFIGQASNPSGLGFFEEHMTHRSGYEAMCDLDFCLARLTVLENLQLVVFHSEAYWPSGVARHYKISASLTQLGHEVATALGIKGVESINREILV